jgi:hypothetical protein
MGCPSTDHEESDLNYTVREVGRLISGRGRHVAVTALGGLLVLGFDAMRILGRGLAP